MSQDERATAAPLPKAPPIFSLDPKNIPPADRAGWQPKEMVALLGSSRGRAWGGVFSIAYSPDGKRIASCGDDCYVSLWDAATLQPIAVVGGFDSCAVFSLAFSPDGKKLAADGAPGLTVWTVENDRLTHRLTAKLPEHAVVRSIAFSHDGKILAAGMLDGSVDLWDITGKELVQKHVLKITSRIRRERKVYGVAFAPDDKTLACAITDSTIRLWDLTGKKPVERTVLTGHTNYLMSVAFRPDGKMLASGGNDRSVRLWDMSATPPRQSAILNEHSDKVTCVAFSPDGKTLAAVGTDPVVRLWKLGDGKPKPWTALKGHWNEVRSVSFSPDGKTLATGARDDTIRLWDLTKDKPTEKVPVRGHKAAVVAMRFSKNGRSLITASRDCTVIRWKLDEDKPVLRSQMARRNDGWAVGLDNDGERLALSFNEPSGGYSVQLFQTSRLDKEGAVVTKGRDEVGQMAFSPTGRMLACAKRTAIELWDLAALPFRKKVTLPGSAHRTATIAFSPDGKILAVGDLTETVKVWDLSDEKPRELAVPVQDEQHGVYVLAFSPDGKTLAVGDTSGEVRLWSLEARAFKTKTICKGKDCTFPVLTFSPDGKKVAAAGIQGHVVVWDSKGEKLHEWRFPGPVRSARFAPDNRHLALGLANATVSILRLPK
jgi:WD40 repeat protein